jgi:hypothetical protein
LDDYFVKMVVKLPFNKIERNKMNPNIQGVDEKWKVPLEFGYGHVAKGDKDGSARTMRGYGIPIACCLCDI